MMIHYKHIVIVHAFLVKSHELRLNTNTVTSNMQSRGICLISTNDVTDICGPLKLFSTHEFYQDKEPMNCELYLTLKILSMHI